jgi:hypothetical protein
MLVVQAVRRYWPVVAVSIVVCLALAVALGLERHPTYRAEAKLNVGRLDAQTQAVPGFVEAAKSLASAYSRLAASERSSDQIARIVGKDADYVRSHLTVSPIPDDPIIKVAAAGKSKAEAVGLARAATRVTTASVRQLTTEQDGDRSLLADFQRLTGRAEEAADRLRALKRGPQTASRREQITKLRIDEASYRLRAQAVSQTFVDARLRSTGGASITVLDSGSVATDDRKAVLQQLIVLGLIGGLLFGSLVATWLWTRSLRKRAPWPVT